MALVVGISDRWHVTCDAKIYFCFTKKGQKVAKRFKKRQKFDKIASQCQKSKKRSKNYKKIWSDQKTVPKSAKMQKKKKKKKN